MRAKSAINGEENKVRRETAQHATFASTNSRNFISVNGAQRPNPTRLAHDDCPPALHDEVSERLVDYAMIPVAKRLTSVLRYFGEGLPIRRNIGPVS